MEIVKIGIYLYKESLEVTEDEYFIEKQRYL